MKIRRWKKAKPIDLKRLHEVDAKIRRVEKFLQKFEMERDRILQGC